MITKKEFMMGIKEFLNSITDKEVNNYRTVIYNDAIPFLDEIVGDEKIVPENVETFVQRFQGIHNNRNDCRWSKKTLYNKCSILRVVLQKYFKITKSHRVVKRSDAWEELRQKGIHLELSRIYTDALGYFGNYCSEKIGIDDPNLAQPEHLETWKSHLKLLGYNSGYIDRNYRAARNIFYYLQDRGVLNDHPIASLYKSNVRFLKVERDRLHINHQRKLRYIEENLVGIGLVEDPTLFSNESLPEPKQKLITIKTITIGRYMNYLSHLTTIGIDIYSIKEPKEIFPLKSISEIKANGDNHEQQKVDWVNSFLGLYKKPVIDPISGRITYRFTKSLQLIFRSFDSILKILYDQPFKYKNDILSGIKKQGGFQNGRIAKAKKEKSIYSLMDLEKLTAVLDIRKQKLLSKKKKTMGDKKTIASLIQKKLIVQLTMIGWDVHTISSATIGGDNPNIQLNFINTDQNFVDKYPFLHPHIYYGFAGRKIKAEEMYSRQDRFFSGHLPFDIAATLIKFLEYRNYLTKNYSVNGCDFHKWYC